MVLSPSGARRTRWYREFLEGLVSPDAGGVVPSFKAAWGVRSHFDRGLMIVRVSPE
jgi:hypothetical protein